MAIRYRKYQNKIQGSRTYQQWFGKAVVLDTISTEELAEEMAHSTTITEADARAFLCELAHCLNKHLINSQAVKLDGIGLFKPAIKTKPAAKKEDFGGNNITGYKVNFQPETVFTPTGISAKGKRTGFRTKKLLQGATAAVYGDTEKATADAGTGE